MSVLPLSDTVDEHLKRVNIKDIRIGFYRGIPHYKITAANGDRAYAYDLDQGVYPTLTKMVDAMLEDKHEQVERD